jgi:hypothetical protein
MTLSQDGKLYSGSFGWPIDFILGPSPISMVSVSSITLNVKRPSAADYDLAPVMPLSSIVDITAGVIRWTPVDGDLSESGVYAVKLTTNFGSGARLVSRGLMHVG